MTEELRGHYSDGRRWSWISNAWILNSNWNDKEEIAALKHRHGEVLVQNHQQAQDIQRLRDALELLRTVVTDANRERGMSWGPHFGRLMTALGKASDELRSNKIPDAVVKGILTTDFDRASRKG